MHSSKRDVCYINTLCKVTMSHSEEKMDADDDPLYVPDPDDERDEDEDFADDCLYE